MVAKVLKYIGAAVVAAYMIFLGSMFGAMAADSDEPSIILLLLLVLLAFDFLGRFMTQQTPMVFIKPYMLMPIPAKTVVESYLLTILTSGYNFLWLSLLLPYAYICIVAGVGFWLVFAVVVCGMLMDLVNSLWYLLARTLIVRSRLWWLLPIAVYGTIVLPFFLVDDFMTPINLFVDTFYAVPMIWLLSLFYLGLLVALFLLNRHLQYKFVCQEITRVQKKSAAIKHVSQFTFLERYGQTGEYLKLEIKSIMRNKAIRARVTMSLWIIVIFSALISYTDIYDDGYILNFWCYYCYAIYGMTTLTKIMGPEGNYIDLLMTHRENILSLLKAKYLFHVVILVIPLLIMLPAVIAGKFTMLMMLAYFLLTSGLNYFIMFQLAVSNKQTLPLDAKLTGKNNVESGIQLLVELTAMFAPLILMGLLLLLVDVTTAYILMASIGFLLTVTHPLWLRHIYRRMMNRKYANLEGFHASR